MKATILHFFCSTPYTSKLALSPPTAYNFPPNSHTANLVRVSFMFATSTQRSSTGLYFSTEERVCVPSPLQLYTILLVNSPHHDPIFQPLCEQLESICPLQCHISHHCSDEAVQSLPRLPQHTELHS